MPTTPPPEPQDELPEEPERTGSRAEAEGAGPAASAPESAAKLGQMLGGLYGRLAGDPEAGKRLGERAGENLRGLVSEVAQEAEKRQREAEVARQAAEELRAARERRRAEQRKRKAEMDAERESQGAELPPEDAPAGTPVSDEPGVSATEALEAALRRTQESVRTGLERAVEELAARGSDIASQVAEIRAQKRHVESGEDVWTRATADVSAGEEAAEASEADGLMAGASSSEAEEPSLVAAEVLTALLRSRGYASLAHATACGSEGASEAKRVISQLAELGLLRRPASIPEWEGHELVKVTERLSCCRVCEQTVRSGESTSCPGRPRR